ncbi:hypothetical protein D3C73_1641350 [compost metagenome]
MDVDAIHDCRGIGTAIEDQDRSFPIPPSGVAEELVYRFIEGFRPLPEFAFGNEDITICLSQ